MEDNKDVIQDLVLIYRIEQNIDYKNSVHLQKLNASLQQKKPFRSIVGQRYCREILTLAEGKPSANQCVVCSGERESHKMLCPSCADKIKAVQVKEPEPKKKNHAVTAAIALILVGFIAFVLYAFGATPQKTIEKLFNYCTEGDVSAVENSFDGTEEQVSELVKVMGGMIFADDTVLDVQILEEQYNEDKSQVRMDCLFTVQDTAGKQWTYREYFYLRKSAVIGWEIYDIREYSGE